MEKLTVGNPLHQSTIRRILREAGHGSLADCLDSAYVVTRGFSAAVETVGGESKPTPVPDPHAQGAAHLARMRRMIQAAVDEIVSRPMAPEPAPEAKQALIVTFDHSLASLVAAAMIAKRQTLVRRHAGGAKLIRSGERIMTTDKPWEDAKAQFPTALTLDATAPGIVIGNVSEAGALALFALADQLK